MKINSRFTDFYDFLSCSDRDDTVSYNRKYNVVKYENILRSRSSSDSITGNPVLPPNFQSSGVQFSLLFGEIELIFKLHKNEKRYSWENCNYIHPIRDYDIERYCDVLKSFTKVANHKRTDRTALLSEMIISHDAHFGIPKGKVVLQQYMRDAINCGNCTVEYRYASTIRNALNITAPTALIDLSRINQYHIHSDIGVVVFENISFQNSGFMEFIDHADLEMLGGAIDAYICTEDNSEQIVEISDEYKIAGAGFDNKLSFRHRKKSN